MVTVYILAIEIDLINFPILNICTFIVDVSLINVLGNQIVYIVINMKIQQGDKPCTKHTTC